MPPGGTWMYSLRPSQNISVAIAIKTPGTPKATCGPYHSSSQGVSSVESVEPKLIEK